MMVSDAMLMWPCPVLTRSTAEKLIGNPYSSAWSRLQLFPRGFRPFEFSFNARAVGG